MKLKVNILKRLYQLSPDDHDNETTLCSEEYVEPKDMTDFIVSAIVNAHTEGRKCTFLVTEE